MAFCTECGANVPDDVKFCTACGKPVNMAAGAAAQAVVPPLAAQPQAAAPPPAVQPQAAAPPPAAQPQAVVQPQAVIQPQPVPVYAPQPGQVPAAADAPPPADSKYAVMGTGSFILLSILFAIPIVGQIACIVMAFAAKNLNRRHFARAALIFLIIGLVISVILFFVGRWVMDAATSYLYETGSLIGALDGPAGIGGFLNNMVPVLIRGC